jgi:molecular chaperone HscA
LKELLFTTGKVEYVLADSSIGTVVEEDFIQHPNVMQFAKRLEDGFREALEAVDESYLDYLAIEGVTLQVILTGGSAKLPMMKALGEGYLTVKGRTIKRVCADATPEWMKDETQEMIESYLQLAVAIGGASDELPRTDFAPSKLGRVSGPTYVSSNLALSGT